MSVPASAAASLQRIEPDSQTTQHGLAPRRGKELSINTIYPQQQETMANVQRPPPVETVLYRSSPESALSPAIALADHSRHVSRRASKIGLRGIFGKSKASKVGKIDEQSSRPNSRDLEVSSSISSDTPFFLPPSREPSGEKATPGKLKSKKDRHASHSLRPLVTWDPPPLFQAQPSAIRAGGILTPALPADVVLRMDKEKRSLEDKADGLKVAEGNAGSEPGTKKTHKRQGSNLVDCTNKLFLLTTTGFLLQYADGGSHDRLPERIMQLGKDSAAFASDAIVGKHWVLQVCQTTSEEGTPATSDTRKSVFNKMGFGGGMKRPVSNFLLVMGSAEEMDSWLVAIRREIQELGGKAYRPDEISRNSSLNAMQLLKEKPSRRFLIQNKQEQQQQQQQQQFSLPSSPLQSPLNTSPPLRPHRSSIGLVRSYWTAGASQSSPPLPAREYEPTRTMEKAKLEFDENFPQPLHTHGSSPNSSNRFKLGRRASSAATPSSPTTLGPDRDKALPAAPKSGSLKTLSPVNALGIVGDDKEYRWLPQPSPGLAPQPSPGFAPQPSPGFETQFAMTPLISSFSQIKPKAMMPVSAFNADHNKNGGPLSPVTRDRKLSVGSVDSQTRNFSIPNFSRASHTRQSSEDRVTTSGSTVTSRARTPSLTDGESARPDSVVGELPNSIRSVQRSIFQTQVGIAIAVPMSPMRAEAIQNRLPEVAYVPPESRPKIPRRMSSLEYGSGQQQQAFAFDASVARTASVLKPSCMVRPQRLSSLPTCHPAEDTVVVELEGSSQMLAPSQALPSSQPAREYSSSHSSPAKSMRGLVEPARSFSPTEHSPNDSMNPRKSYRKNSPSRHSSNTLKLPKAAPMTIQERRMLLGKRNFVANLPPPLPPPTSALPPPPIQLPLVPSAPGPGATNGATSGAPVIKLQPIKAPRLNTLACVQATRDILTAPPTPPTRGTSSPALEAELFERTGAVPDSPPHSEKRSEDSRRKVSTQEERQSGQLQVPQECRKLDRCRPLREENGELDKPPGRKRTSTMQCLEPLIPEIQPMSPLSTGLGLDLPRELTHSPTTESWSKYLQRMGVSN